MLYCSKFRRGKKAHGRYGSAFLAALGPYGGYIIGAAALVAVLFFNQLVYRHRWNSYPTLAQYLAAHPECNNAKGLVCDRCGTKAARASVSARGHIYRCSWCETELYRIDHDGGDRDLYR